MDYSHVRFANEIVRRALIGEHVILLHNLDSGAEWVSDPACILERVYMSLGPSRFSQYVTVFGSKACRYSCLPIRPLSDVPAFLEQLTKDIEEMNAPYTVLALANDTPKELRSLTVRLRQRFALNRQPSAPWLMTFSLAPRLHAVRNADRTTP